MQTGYKSNLKNIRLHLIQIIILYRKTIIYMRETCIRIMTLIR